MMQKRSSVSDTKPLRVAMLAPVAWRTPPRHYGPWERATSLLSEGLVRLGVDLTLFATCDSETSGHLHAVVPVGYEEGENIDAKVWSTIHIAEVFERAAEFDIIHNQFDFPPLAYSRMVRTPVVTTIHGFSSPDILPVYRRYNDSCWYVAISDADRAEGLDYIETIHHGIDIAAFTFNNQPDDYLLYFGRIHHDKGTREAIEIARRCSMRLVIAGIIQDAEYYRAYVEPTVDGVNVQYVGSVYPEQRNLLLQGARALLHPIQFNEPFGLSVVAAMACGTPVIAFNRGSMPELIEPGVNGWLVDDVASAVAAVDRLSAIDRANCRLAVENRFTDDVMARNYLNVYHRMLSGEPPGASVAWGPGSDFSREEGIYEQSA